MSSTIEVKHTVELKCVYCMNNHMIKETRQYKTSNCKSSKQVNKQTFVNLSRMAATVDDQSFRNISYVRKKYEQATCYINGRLSSVLIDVEDETKYLLYSELLEKIEKENAKSVFYIDGDGMMLRYLTYGYEYVKDGNLYERTGFFNSYERDVEGFREANCMFGRFIGNFEMSLEGIDESGTMHTKMKKIQ